MALLFIDSFDHYATAQIGEKWTTAAGTTPTISNVEKRTGTQALLLSGSAVYVRRAVVSSSTLIVGLACRGANLLGTLSVKFYTATPTEQCSVKVNGDGSVQAERYLNNVLGTSAVGVMANNEWQYLEVKATFNDTTGAIVVRVNGVEVLNLSNVDTANTAGITACTIVHIQSSSGDIYVDDVYICDTTGGVNDDFLGDVRIDAYLPDGAGTTTQWTPSAGSNYACVDDVTPNGDTDYVVTDTVDEIDTYSVEDLVNTGASILGVQVSAYCLKTDAGDCSLAPVIRDDGTNYVGTTVALGTTYAYHIIQTYDTNPGTAAQWQEAEFNAAEFGVKRIA